MDKYIRNKEIISGQIQDEIVMMDIESGEYYSLNSVATRIWELLENEMDINSLCEALIMEFDVGKKQCVEEAKEHLEKLMELNLVSKIP